MVPVTTAGLVSGTREQLRPTTCSRAAAAASIALGALLLDALPDLVRAAFYLAVLAAAAAVVALAAGYLLWTRVSLVPRTVAFMTAGAVLTGELLQLFPGLPGVGDLGSVSTLEVLLLLVAAASVMALLVADALRRKPEPAPDRPYAL